MELRYELLTEAGVAPVLLHKGLMPPFQVVPGIVVWGERAFRYVRGIGREEAPLQYLETFCVRVPDEMPPAPQVTQ